MLTLNSPTLATIYYDQLWMHSSVDMNNAHHTTNTASYIRSPITKTGFFYHEDFIFLISGWLHMVTKFALNLSHVHLYLFTPVTLRMIVPL